MMNKKLIISFLIGILISAAALYFAFRNVPFTDLLQYLKTINFLWVLPAILMVLVSFVLRAIRWQYIVTSSHPIGFREAYHPMMIGFMINLVLPGRLGELARPAILHRKENVPFITGLATVAAERVFDLLLLLVFFAFMFTTIEIDPNFVMSFGEHKLNRATLEAVFSGMAKMGVVLILGMIIVSLDSFRRRLTAMISAFPSFLFFISPVFQKKISDRICRPIINMIEKVAQGFTLLKSPKKIAVCTLLTAAVWSLQAFSYYVCAMGTPGVDVSFFEMYASMIIICFFIALPSVPGWWGLWEAGGVFALMLFGVSSKNAIGYTLVNHAVQVFPIILAGLISALLTSVNIWQVSFQKNSVSPTGSKQN